MNDEQIKHCGVCGEETCPSCGYCLGGEEPCFCEHDEEIAK